jgi:hypothetical protein
MHGATIKMLMISSWIEGMFRKNVEKKLMFYMEYIFSENRKIYKKYGRASEVFEIVDDRKLYDVTWMRLACRVIKAKTRTYRHMLLQFDVLLGVYTKNC